MGSSSWNHVLNVFSIVQCKSAKHALSTPEMCSVMGISRYPVPLLIIDYLDMRLSIKKVYPHSLVVNI